MMTEQVTLNESQRLYVIPANGGYMNTLFEPLPQWAKTPFAIEYKTRHALLGGGACNQHMRAVILATSQHDAAQFFKRYYVPTFDGANNVLIEASSPIQSTMHPSHRTRNFKRWERRQKWQRFYYAAP